jgi:signal transduction histidine kinase
MGRNDEPTNSATSGLVERSARHGVSGSRPAAQWARLCGERWQGPLGPHQFLNPLGTITFSIVGVLVASRHPRNPIGWLLNGTGFVFSLSLLALGYWMVSQAGAVNVPLPGIELARWLNDWVWILEITIPLTFLLLRFPNGRLLSPRWRPIAWLVGLGLVGSAAGSALYPGDISAAGRPNPVALTASILAAGAWLLLLMGIIGSMASLVVRFRRSNGVERDQLKWLVYAVGLAPLIVVVGNVVPATLWPGSAREFGIAAPGVAIMAIIVAVGIAIVRHHLYDIDLIINRTMVYGVLTALVAGIYLVVVGVLGALFQARGNPALSLLGVGLVAVVVQPLRERFQRAVNRLMYGERDEPYTVLTRLGQRLESVIEPAAALSLTVQTVAHALKLPYVAIALKVNAQSQTSNSNGAPQPSKFEVGNSKFEIVASHGASQNPLTRLPLTYAGETIGELVAAARAPNEALSPADQRLLSDLARQISLTAHANLLAADLEHARLRIVAAREETRRRLGRDLHDGVGHQLAGLARRAEMAKHLLDHDPTAAPAMLGEVTEQLNAMILQVRGLAHELHPPELELLGLIGALRERAQTHTGLAIRIDAPETLPPLPTAIETAAYYIALEALTNVEKHAGAKSIQIRLALTHVDSMLELDIADDGRGLPPEKANGLGLLSMEARAAEVGGIGRIESTPQGGTRVSVRLPCRPQLE